MSFGLKLPDIYSMLNKYKKCGRETMRNPRINSLARQVIDCSVHLLARRKDPD